MLVVDPRHWLREDGSFPDELPELRPRIVRVARFVESGALLRPLQTRETLIECKNRPGGRPCLGFMVVAKHRDDSIEGFCPECGEREVWIHSWQQTRWARGPADPVRDPKLVSPGVA